MQLGISGQVLGNVKNLDEILQILKKHGVGFIEIWPFNVPLKGKSVCYQEDRYEERSIEKVKEITKNFGINVACVTMPGAFSKAMSANPSIYTESLLYTVDVAKELGSKVVNHYCYYFALGHKADTKEFIKIIEPAVKRAEELDITMVLENEAHDASGTPEGMLKILKSVASKRCKTTFDPCNYYHASQEAFPYAYDLLKDYIEYVHLKNGCIFSHRAGHSEDSKGAQFGGVYSSSYIYYPILPQGAVNIEGLLNRLHEDGYNGCCTLEPHTTPDNAELYYQKEILYLRNEGFFRE